MKAAGCTSCCASCTDSWAVESVDMARQKPYALKILPAASPANALPAPIQRRRTGKLSTLRRERHEALSRF